MDAALGRRERQLEDVRDLLVREAEHVAEDERSAVVGLELPDPGGEERLELARLGRLLGLHLGVRGDEQPLGGLVERCRCHPLPAEPAESLVDGDPVQPGEDGRVAAEAVEVAPGLDEAVLGRLLDVAVVVEQPHEHAAHAPLVAVHDLGEGIDVTGARLREEHLVVGNGHREDRMVRSRIDWEGRRITVDMELILRPWVATCTETQEHLSEALEGELRGRTARRVRRHLRICPHCREALRSLSRAVDGLRALGRADTSTDPDHPSVAGPVADRIRRGDP